MDFNKWIEKIDGMAGIYAFDIMEDGSFGEIKLMGVNSKNKKEFYRQHPDKNRRKS